MNESKAIKAINSAFPNTFTARDIQTVDELIYANRDIRNDPHAYFIFGTSKFPRVLRLDKHGLLNFELIRFAKEIRKLAAKIDSFDVAYLMYVGFSLAIKRNLALRRVRKTDHYIAINEDIRRKLTDSQLAFILSRAMLRTKEEGIWELFEFEEKDGKGRTVVNEYISDLDQHLGTAVEFGYFLWTFSGRRITFSEPVERISREFDSGTLSVDQIHDIGLDERKLQLQRCISEPFGGLGASMTSLKNKLEELLRLAH